MPAVIFAATEATKPAAEQFDIWEIRVLGNTVLPAVAIEKTVYPFLGPHKSIAVVEEARTSLEAAYRDAGYGTVFVDIPEQDVDEGVVRIKVTEGRLDRIRIVGARYFANRRIRAAIPSLASGTVLHLPDLQSELATVNRQSRDRQVTPVLRAGHTPGTVDVELKVQDSLPVHASVEVNDRYSPDTTRTRASANLSFNNLFQRYQSLEFQYQTAPERNEDARVIGATYVVPFESLGHTLAVYGVDSDTNVETAIASTIGAGSALVRGKGRIYGARYIVPLDGGDDFFPSLTFGADFKDFDQNVRPNSGPEDRVPIKYLNWSAAFGATTRGENTLTNANAALNFGIRGVVNSSDEFHFKRFTGQPNKGEPSYLYLRVGATHERPLFGPVQIFGQLSGQYTPQALISNEQFAIGGADTVRGYTESEQLGDYGASATLEARWSFGSLLGKNIQKAHLAAFVDGGIVGIVAPLADQQGVIVSRSHLYSAGLGIRLLGFDGLQTDLDWAYPFVATDRIAAGDSRIHFRMRYGF